MISKPLKGEKLTKKSQPVQIVMVNFVNLIGRQGAHIFG